MQIIHAQHDGTYLAQDSGAVLDAAALAEMVRRGEAFKIVTPAQEKDVTSQVLAEIFIKEGLDTKQVFFKRYVLDGLKSEGARVESLAKRLLFAGIGLAEESIERFETLVSKGEGSERGFAKSLKDGYSKLEAAPKTLQERVDALLRKPNAPVEVLTARVESLTETVEQLNGHPKEARTSKKSVSA